MLDYSLHSRSANASQPLVAGLLLVFGVVGATELWQFCTEAQPASVDFFGIWSWSRFVATHGAPGLYDQAAMQAFQASLDGLYRDRLYPFLYPPTYLLFIWPLGYLPLAVARIAWSVTTLAAFLLALSGARVRPMLLLAGLVAPATIVCLSGGQNGLLTGALMIGGLRCAQTRPRLAGLLLGLLTYKPHFAVLVPVALIAARLWPALLATAVTAACAVLASALLFGVQTWVAWFAAEATSWTTITAFVAARANMIPTVSAALHQLGVDGTTASGVQFVAALAAASALWIGWRRGIGTRAILIMPVAALLTTPYAFVYDLPMLTGAALLDLTGRRDRPAHAVAFLGLALLLPQLMINLQDSPAPLASPVLILLLLWLLLPFKESKRCV